MNDFTEEELNELNLTLQGYDFDNTDLIYKIQSMIDNYCEHDYSESLIKMGDIRSRSCNKCGCKK